MPVTPAAVVGLNPRSPLITVGPVLATVVAARTAKGVAAPSPGAVDASAGVKLSPTIRAETVMESVYRSVRLTAAMIARPCDVMT